MPIGAMSTRRPSRGRPGTICAPFFGAKTGPRAVQQRCGCTLGPPSASPPGLAGAARRRGDASVARDRCEAPRVAAATADAGSRGASSAAAQRKSLGSHVCCELGGYTNKAFRGRSKAGCDLGGCTNARDWAAMLPASSAAARTQGIQRKAAKGAIQEVAS